MSDEITIRPRERAIASPAATDAGLAFVGRIETPWIKRLECPRQGSLDGPIYRIVVFEPWTEALLGIAKYQRLEVLYWLHGAGEIWCISAHSMIQFHAERSVCDRRFGPIRLERQSYHSWKSMVHRSWCADTLNSGSRILSTRNLNDPAVMPERCLAERTAVRGVAALICDSYSARERSCRNLAPDRAQY